MFCALTSRLARSACAAAAVLAVSGGAYALAAEQSPPRATASANADAPRVRARFHDAPVSITGRTLPLALELPAGRFLVFGKASVRQDAGKRMFCRLTAANGSFDETDLRASGQPTRQAFTLTVLHLSSSPESVSLACEGPDRFANTVDGTLRDIKLTAIEVGDVSNVPG
jgi:hypothetical protein